MDSPEPGASSSSPNVNQTVLSICQQEDLEGEGCITLSGGSSFFVPLPLIREKGVQAGDFVDSSLLSFLEKHSLTTRCRHKCVDYLAKREHSRRQLTEKLLNRGFPLDIIERVLDGLEEKGLQSDKRFAREWLRVKLVKPDHGAVWYRAELMKRGVAYPMAADVVFELFTEDLQKQAVKKARRDAERRYKGDHRRILSYLGRRGFSPEQITERF